MIIDTTNFDENYQAYSCCIDCHKDLSGKSYAELISTLGDEPLDDDELEIMFDAVTNTLAHRKTIVNLAAKICGAVDDFAGDSADVKA